MRVYGGGSAPAQVRVRMRVRCKTLESAAAEPGERYVPTRHGQTVRLTHRRTRGRAPKGARGCRRGSTEHISSAFELFRASETKRHTHHPYRPTPLLRSASALALMETPNHGAHAMKGRTYTAAGTPSASKSVCERKGHGERTGYPALPAVRVLVGYIGVILPAAHMLERRVVVLAQFDQLKSQTCLQN